MTTLEKSEGKPASKTLEDEWICGYFKMPKPWALGDTTGDALLGLEVVVWLRSTDLMVLGYDMMGLDELLAPGRLTTFFDRTLVEIEEASKAPDGGLGPLRRPSAIRAATRELAQALEREFGTTKDAPRILHAPTPEMKEVEESFHAFLESKATELERQRKMRGDAPSTYLSADVTPEMMGRLFHATARMYRAAPWDALPSLTTSLYITSEALGMQRYLACFVGEVGDAFGLLLFKNDADYDRYAQLGALALHDREAALDQVAPHLVLDFDAAPPHLRKEVEDHRWETADLDAFPSVMVVDQDGGRPANAGELEIFEAVALAVAELVEKNPSLGDTLEETAINAIDSDADDKHLATPLHYAAIDVALNRGLVRVELSIEALRNADGDDDDDFDAASLASDFDDDLDEDEARILAITEEFYASPEGQPFSDRAQARSGAMGYSYTFLTHAAARGASFETLTPTLVEDIVFEGFPRSVICRAEHAERVIHELRAFFRYVSGSVPHADACLAVLDVEDAVSRLRMGLSNPRKFEKMKTLLMAGFELGYDVTTEEGVNAFLDSMDKKTRSPAPSLSKAERDAKRNKRKAQRAQRKKRRAH